MLSDSSPDVPPLYAETPLAEWVDASVFSCLVRLKKPDPDIYELVCKYLRVSPNQCVYVGDGGSRELSGAQAVGMRRYSCAFRKVKRFSLKLEHGRGKLSTR